MTTTVYIAVSLPRGWRYRIGKWLRKWASELDAGHTVTLYNMEPDDYNHMTAVLGHAYAVRMYLNSHARNCADLELARIVAQHKEPQQ